MNVPVCLLLGLATSGYLLKDQKQEKEELSRKRKKVLDQRVKDIKDPSINQTQSMQPFYFNGLAVGQNRMSNPDYDTKSKPVDGSSVPKMVGGSNGVGEVVPFDIMKHGDLSTYYHALQHTVTDDSAITVRAHNNMVPFFRGSVKQNTDIENRQGAGKLENFTGNYALRRRRKSEAVPLFEPIPQDIFQLDAPRDISRTVAGMPERRNNELPFDQVMVGPGLNQGFTAEPSGGLHDRLRIMPKDNDLLHVNPRSSHEGRLLRGKSMVPQRTSQSITYKHLPELLVSNFDGERNFTTTGAIKKPTARGQFFIQPAARDVSKTVEGAAYANRFSTPESLFGKRKISTRQNFMGSPYRNLVGKDHQKAGFDAHYNFENRPNERSVTGVRSVLANLKSLVSKLTMPFMDSARQTRKEEHEHNARPTGNASSVVSKGQTYNPDSVAKPTIRETTENASYLPSVTPHSKGPVFNPKSTAKTTMRELYENNTTSGVLTGHKKSHLVNAFERARQTMRELTENNDHQGHMASSSKMMRATYDPSDTAKTTHRETMEDNHGQGFLTGGSYHGVTYNPDSMMKTTHRETTEDNPNGGNLTGGSHRGGVYNPADCAKTTHREIDENNEHYGHLSGGKYKSTRLHNPNDPAKTTGRETLEDNGYTGNLSQLKFSGLAYNPCDVAKTTGRETLEANGHVGNFGHLKFSGLAYNPCDVAKTTGRETLEANDHTGNFGHLKFSDLAYNPCDVAKTTGRETLEANGHTGNFGHLKFSGLAYDPCDVAKTTGRETLESNGHTGNLGQLKFSGLAYNPCDTAKTTIRETTEADGYSGPLSNGRKSGRVYDASDSARTTGRELRETDSYAGQFTGERRSGAAYDPSNIARTTVRETTETNSHSGQLYAGRTAGSVYNPADAARTTVRETTEINDHNGQLRGDRHPGVIYDENAVARTTGRQLTERNSHSGQLCGGKMRASIYNADHHAKTTFREMTGYTDHFGACDAQSKRSRVYDENDTARTTGRECTEQSDYIGAASALSEGGYYIAKPEDIPTQRQFTCNFEYTGTAGPLGAHGKAPLYDAAYNATQNTNMEIIAQGREPANPCLALHSGTAYTNVRVKKHAEDEINQYASAPNPTNPMGRIPDFISKLTSMRNSLPPEDTRLDTSLLDRYKENPLTQSLLSWA